jgi:tight adherence protein B
MKWMKASLDSAGLSRLSPVSAMSVIGLIGLVAYSITYELSSIFALSLGVAIGLVGFALELLTARAHSRSTNLTAHWPEVVDSIISSVSAGGSISESLIDLANEGPNSLRPLFQHFRSELDAGKSLANSLATLKRRLANHHADRLIELLGLVNDAGGGGMLDALRNQADLVRKEIAFAGEISSKLGWITGTAKIAVGAPWLIVLMLSTRPENASAYASTGGSFILVLGLAISIFAYRLVQSFGRLPEAPRVFA